MAKVLALAALLLLGSSEARQCSNFTVPVNVSSQTGNFNISKPRTQVDIVTFIQEVTKPGRNYSQTLLTGYKTTSGTYNISAQYCKPENSTDQPFVQVMTHGSGYDKTYWDVAYQNYNYSYVNSALAAGYHTFTYDRLGIGNSSNHLDPLNEIQVQLEIEALVAVTQKLIDGSIPEVGHAFGKNIVHVGHSIGSGQTMAFAGQHPNMTSGIILTGWSMNQSGGNEFYFGSSFQDAAKNQPLRFGDIDVQTLETHLRFDYSSLGDKVAPLSLILDNIPPGLNYTPGYIVGATASNQQAVFMHAPNFDPALLDVTEALKQPSTYGELLSAASGTPHVFQGPVLVFTGENDLPLCGGDCYNVAGTNLSSIPEDIIPAYPGNNAVEIYIQPDTGHATTLHLNATAGYNVMLDFLKKHNLS